MARDRRDPRERLVAPRGLRPVRRRSPLRRRPHHGRGAGGVHRRAGPAGPEEAARVPGLRHPLHARPSPRRADGVVGRGLCGLLSLSPEEQARRDQWTRGASDSTTLAALRRVLASITPALCRNQLPRLHPLLPAADRRARHGATGPRRRRTIHAEPDRRPVPPGLRRPTVRGRRPTTARWCEIGAADAWP